MKKAVPAPNQQDTLAMLMASRKYTVPEISRALAIPLNQIYALRESPLFLTLVNEYERRFVANPAEADLLDKDDIAKTVATLRDFRDGAITDSPQMAGLRLRAAQSLFERQLPKPPPQALGAAGPKVVINIDASRMETWKKLVDAETGEVIDIEADE